MSLWSLLEDALKNNQFFSGGMMLGAITTVLYSLKSVPLWLWRRIDRNIRYTVLVEQRTELFEHIQRWVMTHHKKQLRNVRAYYVDPDGYSPVVEVRNHGINVVQNEDYFITFYRGRFISISSNREKLEHPQDFNLLYHNSYEITGLFAKHAINKLLEEATQESKKIKQEQKLPDFYHNIHYGEWKRQDIKFREIDNLFFDHGIKEDIVADMAGFYDSKKFYDHRGLPFRRGYLFYGAPGTGKSALSSALAKRFHKNLYRLNMEILGESDLGEVIGNIPSGSILLIEDIDTVFDGRKSLHKVKFGSFINAISGVASMEDVVTIITTNHIEKLDPALLRSGRIDKRVELGLVSSETISAYLSFFYEQPVKVECKPRTMSEIENLCVKNNLMTLLEILRSGNE